MEKLYDIMPIEAPVLDLNLKHSFLFSIKEVGVKRVYANMRRSAWRFLFEHVGASSDAVMSRGL